MDHFDPVFSETDISVPSADDRVHQAIMSAILSHRLPPGTRLVEAPLCRVFGITRGVLRRVFVKLAHEGVIELQPNRGAIIAEHNIEEAREVFSARIILEMGSIHGAARKADRKAVKQLRSLVEREQFEWERGNWREWVRLSGEFHLRLAELNRNNIVNGYLRVLVARTSLLIGLYETPKQHACSAAEHGDILSAVEQGDVERAAALLQAHLDEIADSLLVGSTNSPEVDFATLFGLSESQ